MGSEEFLLLTTLLFANFERGQLRDSLEARFLCSGRLFESIVSANKFLNGFKRITNFSALKVRLMGNKPRLGKRCFASPFVNFKQNSELFPPFFPLLDHVTTLKRDLKKLITNLD